MKRCLFLFICFHFFSSSLRLSGTCFMAPWREMNGLQGLFIILVMEKERVQLSNEQRVSQYLTRTLQKSVALSLLWLCVRNKGDLPLGQYRGEKEEKKKKKVFIFVSFSFHFH
ncbi:hypothetical protein OUZ56_031354 [Daphnia magna]|uniref:Secreted protein n=1 Tax=Daphnia magna TaxID=35525 RepID=A0ABQ9ZTZ8_9CRUS|nr:hypothetical protein OUZ56_031354 [Daphnia magna]